MDSTFCAYNYKAGKQPFMFVSYAHEDAVQVYPIIKQLHERGVRIWYDKGIKESTEWMAEIADALEHCTAFITFLSKKSIQRNMVKREILFALERYDHHELQFIPVFLEEMELPGELKFPLGPIQALMKFQLTDDVFFLKLTSILGDNIQMNTAVHVINVELAKYQDVLLEKPEYDALMDLEKLTGEPIPITQHMSSHDYAVVISQKHVIKLGLYMKKLTFLPKSIGNLIALQDLNLNQNQLINLPESIGNLTELRILTIISNNLSSLPESIGNLTALLTLDLNKNKLTTLPEGIKKLPELCYLDVRGNEIAPFPAAIHQMLQELKNNGCRIEE